MQRLRALANEEDRPVSEVIRRAAERFLEQHPYSKPRKPLLLDDFICDLGGDFLRPIQNLRTEIYEEKILHKMKPHR